MSILFERVGSAQQEQAGVQVQDGFLHGDPAQLENITQHDNGKSNQDQGERHPGRHLADALGKAIKPGRQYLQGGL